MGRKGISMERTFRPISDRAELEAKVSRFRTQAFSEHHLPVSFWVR